MTNIRRALRAFWKFWWDFLIGDTPELFVAVLLIVGAAFALRDHRIAGVIVLPVLAAACLAASARRGLKGRRTKEEDS